MFRKIIWFDDSPDVGKMECICSYCGKIIKENTLIRIWNRLGQEARFHPVCFDELIKIGINANNIFKI